MFATWYSDLTLRGREFCKRNKTTYTGKGGSSVYGTKPQNERKLCKNDFSSLAYMTPIRLSFCISAGEGVLDRGREREFL